MNKIDKEKIYWEKGFYDMPNTLKPEIFKNIPHYYDLVEINEKNRVATINKDGDFSILTIDNYGNVSIKVIVKGFPPHTGDSIHSDPENNMLWQIRGRGVYLLDLETKKTAHVIASSNPNDEITNNYLFDSENKLFYFGLTNHGIHESPYNSYAIINSNHGSKLFESKLIAGTLYKIDNSNFLFKEFYNKGHAIRWYITDIYMKKLEQNKLTNKLSQLQINTWPYSKTIHSKRRMMLGTSRLTGTLEYFSIRWSEDFEEVKVEPLIIQRPNGKRIASDFQFSADGLWVKSLIVESTGPIDLPRLIILPIGDMYPQGVSVPIVGGYTSRDSPGSFMDHEEWGPCYLEQDSDYPDKIFIYKLKEGLKLLAEQARDTIGQ